MGDRAPQSWWKFTFLRKKNGSIVMSELPMEWDSNTESADKESKCVSQLEARLEKIMEKSTEKSTKGRHMRVSHSGRFKKKKKVRSSLSENPGFFSQAEKAGEGEP